MNTHAIRPTFTELATEADGWTVEQLTELGITATDIALAAWELDRPVDELVKFTE
ncbi:MULTISPECIES: hypothetical protein [Rhodococcus]|uniref:hypothetical protein n=1 Tax=Rhodococcus TaxID=1827 RepID=UPI00193B0E04|nr:MULTISPECIES: hypothetical protein [Rhodococcus]QRI74841.1 hypothetical protein JQ505_20020 [Rhodococcus aetherivorans]QSE58251.1 hypothetical protein JYA75_21125 [Rhodococcus sp. PSBB066]QSE70427.1 hypothetical protein JYA91_06505 [Rhodococcus sp. PSBB049]